MPGSAHLEPLRLAAPLPSSRTPRRRFGRKPPALRRGPRSLPTGPCSGLGGGVAIEFPRGGMALMQDNLPDLGQFFLAFEPVAGGGNGVAGAGVAGAVLLEDWQYMRLGVVHAPRGNCVLTLRFNQPHER